MGSKRSLSLLALMLILISSRFHMGRTDEFDSNSLDDDDAGPTYSELADDNDVQYVSPVPINDGNVYFWENFDDESGSKKRWQVSRAQKERQDGTSKYDGEWGFQVPKKVIFPDDGALVLKSKAKHAAIAARLDKPFDFRTKPLFVQYEVNFQNGMDCGGAYIKLLSQSSALDLNKFTDKTPYTIMFGPDKCGNEFKLHFIFRHKNPINGTFEEKHAKKPSGKLDEYFTDKKPHVYLLKLFPDNLFEVYVDGSMVNTGSLLSDMEPPVNPPMEIPDVEDKKPADWDERESIPDVSMTKPDDWDEDAPAKIDDPSAVIPAGWLENEEPMIPDETAVRPDDWDDSMDGEWEPPLKNNPLCEGAPGCGIWAPPKIDNPKFKGRWKQPMMSNPNYKGKWLPRNIPNPDYFDDKEPFKMTPIGAVGIEIWAMTDLVLFDNFIITDSEKVLQDWTSKTYDLKKVALDKDSEGLFGRLLSYTNAHPWLWAVYTVVIGLPLVLILTFCCGSSQDKRDDSNKKTDDYVDDVEDEFETAANSLNTTSRSTASSSASTSFRGRQSVEKETLEGGDGEEEEALEEEASDNEDALGNATTEDSSNESGDENEAVQNISQPQPDSPSEVKKRKPRRE